MPATIIKDACKLENSHTARVVIEGTSYDEVSDSTARNLAIRAAAALGLTNCGINKESGPYQPMPDGRPAETAADMRALQQRVAIYGPTEKKFRNEYDCLQFPG